MSKLTFKWHKRQMPKVKPKLFNTIIKHLKIYGFRSLFYKTLFYMLLSMFLIALLMNFLYYINFSRVMIKQAVLQKQESVRQINELLNDDFKKIESAIWAQINNGWLKQVALMSDNSAYDKMEAVLNCMNYMQVEKDKAGIYELFFYIIPLQTYISSSMIYDNDAFFNKRFGCSEQQNAAFEEAMSQVDHYNQYYPFWGDFNKSTYGYSTEPDEQALMLLTTIKMNNLPSIQVGAVVKSQTIVGMLHDKLTSKFESLSLVDTSGKIIFTSESPAISSIIQQNLIEKMLSNGSGTEPGFQIIKEDKSEYLANYTKSPTTGYFIVSLVPMPVILENTSSIKYITLFVSLIIVAVSLIASFILSFFFYKPMVHLLEYIGHDGSEALKQIPNKMYRDEYSAILTEYSQVNSEYKTIREYIENNQTFLITHTLLWICHNIYNKTEIETNLREANLTFSKNRFSVHILSPDDLANWKAGVSPTDQNNIFNMMISWIRITFESLFNTQVFAFVDNYDICVVINHDLLDENLTKSSIINYEKILLAARNLYTYSFSVGIGLSVENIYGLNQSYDQAIQALGKRFFIGYALIHTYKPGENLHRDIYYPTNSRESLLNSIRYGDMQTALYHSAVLLQSTLSDGKYNIYAAKKLIREILTVVIDAFHDKNITLTALFGADYDLIRKFETEQDTLSQSIEFVRQTVEKATHWFEENNQSPEVMSNIFHSYISKHFSEDLSLQSIASEFHFSSSYFCRYFKAMTGSTLVDYINRIRIEKAKQLLETDGNLTIKDICQRVGFNNYNTFSRAFKKYIGISPECYKRNSCITQKISVDSVL